MVAANLERAETLPAALAGTEKPYPNAQTAPVHEKNLAALAVTALAIGQSIIIEEVTPQQARDELATPLSPMVVDTFLQVWSTATGPATTSTTVEDVTGRRARTYAEWAVDHASDFG